MTAPEIIFENQDLVALNKPSGMLTLPDRFDTDQVSLKSWLSKRLPQPFVVHRIDKDTSGLIIFAKTPESHRYLSGLFESRQMEKSYLGLVIGCPAEREGTFDAPIGEHHSIKGKMAVVRKGKAAVTHYRVLESLGKYTWMEFRIETGRTHQIRVHLSNAGHPLVADPIYGNGAPLFLSSIKPKFKLSKLDEEERPLLGRLGLHAYSLSYTGAEGEKVHLEAPLSKDLEVSLKQLRKRAT